VEDQHTCICYFTCNFNC